MSHTKNQFSTSTKECDRRDFESSTKWFLLIFVPFFPIWKKSINKNVSKAYIMWRVISNSKRESERERKKEQKDCVWMYVPRNNNWFMCWLLFKEHWLKRFLKSRFHATTHQYCSYKFHTFVLNQEFHSIPVQKNKIHPALGSLFSHSRLLNDLRLKACQVTCRVALFTFIKAGDVQTHWTYWLMWHSGS